MKGRKDNMDNLPSTHLVEAIDLTHDGLGVCKLDDGYTVFVADLLKGETAEIIVTSRKKNYGFGKVLQRISKSPFRVTPRCRHFFECGGCELMHMEYDVQLSFKKYRTELSLRKEKIEEDRVSDIISMPSPYYYRNKVEIKFHQGEKGLEAGFFRAKSHTLVNLEECHIMGKRTFDIIQLVRNIANELGLKAVDDKNKPGLLRSLLIRESLTTKEIILLFHLKEKTLPEADLIVKKLTTKIPEITGIGITTASDISALATDPITLLYGRDYLMEQVNGIWYQVNFRSFFQVNTAQSGRLYQKALEYADINPKTRMIDAYCGIGSIGLAAAKTAFKVFGIEIVKSAILDARKNAELNDVHNAFFEVGDAEEVLKKWKKYKFDVIVVDPPRRGCTKGFIESLLVLKIPRIVYVSCDQATLARDLGLLVSGGYQVQEVTPIDMFPQTASVESVTLLTL